MHFGSLFFLSLYNTVKLVFVMQQQQQSDNDDAFFNAMFFRLAAFKGEHGHCNVAAANSNPQYRPRSSTTSTAPLVVVIISPSRPCAKRPWLLVAV